MMKKYWVSTQFEKCDRYQDGYDASFLLMMSKLNLTTYVNGLPFDLLIT